MLGINTITLFAALSAPAQAGPNSAVTHELNWELDSQMVSDDNWSQISWTDAVNTIGISGGYGINRNLTLMVGLHHRKYVNDTYIYDFDGEDPTTSFSATQLSVGPKYSVELKSWLRPYATAQAVAWMGTLSADEDLDEEENLNELSWSAFAPGIKAAAGFDIIPLKVGKVEVATHMDFGYGAALNLEFTDENGRIGNGKTGASVGNLNLNGFHVNWGVGIHF